MWGGERVKGEENGGGEIKWDRGRQRRGEEVARSRGWVGY